MFIIYTHIVKSCIIHYFCAVMSIAQNIKSIREERGMLQKQVAAHIGVDKSTYSKIEKEMREVTVQELQKMAQLFDTTIDLIVSYEGNIPKEVTLEDKTDLEQMKLISQLDEEDKQTVLRIIDKMLTNQKFKILV